MTAEEKWQSILESRWPHDTVLVDRIFMALFIAVLEEANGFECGAYIEKEKCDGINQIVVIFPSGEQIRRHHDADPFAPPLLEYLTIQGATKVKIFPSNKNIRRFLEVYWTELFPFSKETT